MALRTDGGVGQFTTVIQQKFKSGVCNNKIVTHLLYFNNYAYLLTIDYFSLWVELALYHIQNQCLLSLALLRRLCPIEAFNFDLCFLKFCLVLRILSYFE